MTPGTVLTARVGDQRHSSSLAISSSGDTITAQPGQDAQKYSGGAGYSGGGGAGSYPDGSAGAGGSDGGDGEDGLSGSGGQGSGVDVSTFTFASWVLSGGEGGEANGYIGGGGGGLLVNNEGPWGNQHKGAGYGAGGGGAAFSEDGQPGLVLIEIN